MEMNYIETFSFEIHQDTQCVPGDTVTVANLPHMHIAIRNLGIASSPSLPFFKGIKGVMEEVQI